VGHPDDDGTAERVVRPPPQRGQFVAKLVVGGPDVVEELDFHHRLEPPRRKPDGAAHDVGLGERGIVHAIAAELALEPPRHLEHPALPLHLVEVLLAAHVGHVLAEQEDPRVRRHIVPEAGSTSGEYTYSSAVSGRGWGDASAMSAASWTSSSTRRRSASSSASVASPSATSRAGKVRRGSRRASCSRSLGGL